MDRFAWMPTLTKKVWNPGGALLLAGVVLLVLAPFAWKQQTAFLRFEQDAPGQQASRSPQAPPLVVTRGNPQVRQVALTFDDGPHPFSTPKLLSVLRAHDVRATFFVVGERAKLYPELVRMEIDEGHTVANHTMRHANMPALPPAEAAEEIAACGRIIREITGETPRYFRPPGGQYDDNIVNLAAQQGYITVLWTDSARDYERPGDLPIENRVLARVGNGAIILLHDGVYQTMDALPRIITRLKRDGYRLVTLDELIQANP
jgi:peptidoglycan/xylan/chitin deacetylase (PgdA/CDA1 family)